MELIDETYRLANKSGGAFSIKHDFSEEFGRKYKSVSGWVETSNGYVRVCSTYCERKYKRSSLSLIKDGLTHYRTFQKFYTARGLVTKAKQFSKEIYGGEKLGTLEMWTIEGELVELPVAEAVEKIDGEWVDAGCYSAHTVLLLAKKLKLACELLNNR